MILLVSLVGIWDGIVSFSRDRISLKAVNWGVGEVFRAMPERKLFLGCVPLLITIDCSTYKLYKTTKSEEIYHLMIFFPPGWMQAEE